MDWGAFVWVVMPFSLKNAPPTYQQMVNKAFKNYLDDFMKLFWMVLLSLVSWPPISPNYTIVSRSVGSMALASTQQFVPSWFFQG
jgi:hypothetical protein